MLNKPFIIVGGGLSGLVAAHALAEAGQKVLLFEAQPYLGGRFSTPRTIAFRQDGQRWSFPIEHGLHGVWQCYHNLKALLKRVNPDVELMPVSHQELIVSHQDDHLMRTEVGHRLRETHLPEPLTPLALLSSVEFQRDVLNHGLSSYLRTGSDLSHLLAFDATTDIERYDNLTVDDLIAKWPPMTRYLFASLTHTGFFGEPNEISLASFMMGLTYYVHDDRRRSSFATLPDEPGTVLLNPLSDRIEAFGGQVYTGARVVGFEFDESEGSEGSEVQGVHVCFDGQSKTEYFPAKGVVLALDAVGMRRLTDAAKLTPILGDACIPRGLPSTSVRLWFADSPPKESPPTGVIGALSADAFFWLHQLQAPYMRWHEATGGSAIEFHLYGNRARAAEQQSDEHILKELDALTKRLWPTCGERIYGDVQRNMPTHTWFEPGTASHLPGIETASQNVVRCGDWIQTDIQSLYLERATVTALLASRCLMERAGVPRHLMPTVIGNSPPASGVRVMRPLARHFRAAGWLPELSTRSKRLKPLKPYLNGTSDHKRQQVGVIGATGWMGERICRQLLTAGIPTLAIGRDQKRLKALQARVPGLSGTRCLQIEDHEALVASANQSKLLINCVGPFIDYGPPVLKAALEAGTSILDLSGEQAWLRHCRNAYDQAARERQMAVINAVGVEGALGELVATYLSSQLEEVKQIEIAHAVRAFLPSTGTRNSAWRQLQSTGWFVEDGSLISTPFAAQSRSFNFSQQFGSSHCISIPAPEVLLLHRHTNANTIASYMRLPRGGILSQAASLLTSLASYSQKLMPSIRKWFEQLKVPWRPHHAQTYFESLISVTGKEGGRARSKKMLLSGGCVYQLTATMVVQLVQQLLEQIQRNGQPDAIGVTSTSQLVEPAAFLKTLITQKQLNCHLNALPAQ